MIIFDNVTIGRGRAPRLDRVSLTIPTGAFMGIAGPNGAGKSTLLKALAQIVKPDIGTITKDGVDLTTLDRGTLSREIHYIPQSTAVPFGYTVEEIVTMGRYQKKSKPEMVDYALDALEAHHLKKRRMVELSQGERQRVYISRAIATECPVLLLDEPTANQDVRHRIKVWRLIQNLQREGRTILISSHDLRITASYCPMMAIFHDCRCVASGPTDKVFDADVMRSAFGVTYDTEGRLYDIC